MKMMNDLITIWNKGGIIMIPLAICSFILMVICIEKIISLYFFQIDREKDFQQWFNWFLEKNEVNNLPVCTSSSTLHQIFKGIHTALPLSRLNFHDHVSNILKMKKHDLDQGLVLLSTIASVAPLFGLLGTTLGMVKVFAKLTFEGETSQFIQLSGGISEALFTTVTGLFIGIPSLIAYNLFVRKIDNSLMHIEIQLNSLIEKFHNQIIH